METDKLFFAGAAALVILCISWPVIRGRRFAKNYPYEKKMLLTAVEYRFYRILKEQCDRYHLLICPKVRMEDFLSVTDRRNVYKYRGYIKSRHIDFILCDSDLHMLAGLELDDPSHNSPAAGKADIFHVRLRRHHRRNNSVPSCLCLCPSGGGISGGGEGDAG